MDSIIFVILLFGCATTVYGQVVNSVRVIGHAAYLTQLVQETMHVVESKGWCSLKLLDVVQDYDTNIYGWHIDGEVTYTNGFVISVGAMDLQQSTVQQLWSFNGEDNTTSVSVQGLLRLHEVAQGFDINAKLKDGDQHFTGIFTHERIDVQLALIKNVNKNQLSTKGTVISLSGGTRRMIYLPTNKLTEFLSLQYQPGSVWDSVKNWASDTFAPIMLEVATTKIEFPGLCYNNC